MNEHFFKNLVVIGGNVSGLAAASQARRIRPDINITVLESGQHISYGTCGLPYYISGEVKNIEDLFVYPKEFFEQKRNINILLNHKVIGLDPSKRELLIKIKGLNGAVENKTINYDKLIICSGASAIIPQIPGIDAKNIFTFRNVEDTLKVKKYIESKNPRTAAIIGGGSIGFLLAEALKKIGIGVFFIEKDNRIFKDFEEEISTILLKRLDSENVRVYSKSTITNININSEGYAESISFKKDSAGQTTISCDMAIVSTGIKANTDFLNNTSIDLGKNRAIRLSNKLQTSYMNIFAAGDCCNVTNIITGKDDYIPTANNAAKMGRIAGENAAGGNMIFEGSVGTKIDKIFDLEVAKTGIGLRGAEELGYNAIKVIDAYPSHARALPGAKNIAVMVIADVKTRKLLGAQMIGAEGVGKRIDIFATALTAGMTIDDIYLLDLSYAPIISTVWDPVNKICGKAILELDKRKF